jgi:molybdenum cofactor guanylyltransferase
MTRILGAILSGGGAARFGSDKLLVDVGGGPLIERVIARLSPQVTEVILLGRPYADWPALPDRPKPDLGPLGGLNAALHYAVEHSFDAVLMVPGDAPDLPMDLVVQLGEGPCYASDSPVTGLWPANLSLVLDAYLAGDNKRAVAAFGDHVGAVAVTLPQPIVNINTPEDYAAFLAR